MKQKEYVYYVEEYSQDTRCYQVTSNVKLTHYEVSNIYREVDDDEKTKSNLSGLMDWEDERFTDHEILNEIKIVSIYNGTEYGDDCQLDITGDLEEIEDEN